MFATGIVAPSGSGLPARAGDDLEVADAHGAAQADAQLGVRAQRLVLLVEAQVHQRLAVLDARLEDLARAHAADAHLVVVGEVLGVGELRVEVVVAAARDGLGGLVADARTSRRPAASVAIATAIMNGRPRCSPTGLPAKGVRSIVTAPSGSRRGGARRRPGRLRLAAEHSVDHVADVAEHAVDLALASGSSGTGSGGSFGFGSLGLGSCGSFAFGGSLTAGASGSGDSGPAGPRRPLATAPAAFVAWSGLSAATALVTYDESMLSFAPTK